MKISSALLSLIIAIFAFAIAIHFLTGYLEKWIAVGVGIVFCIIAGISLRGQLDKLFTKQD